MHGGDKVFSSIAVKPSQTRRVPLTEVVIFLLGNILFVGVFVLAKAMEQGNGLIVISFKSLLEKICVFLGFPEPIFSQSPSTVNGCHVIVCGKEKPHSFVCFGDKDDSSEENFEYAAKKMVFFLVEKYKLCVDDVNLGIWEDYKKVALDFKLKREQLERVEKGQPSLPLTEQLYSFGRCAFTLDARRHLESSCLPKIRLGIRSKD